jgi:hypothetical protein
LFCSETDSAGRLAFLFFLQAILAFAAITRVAGDKYLEAMPTVTETAQIDLDAGSVWKKAGSFGAVGEWHPMLARVQSAGDYPDALRTAETKEGEKQVERLESFGCNSARLSLLNAVNPDARS